MEIKGEIVVGIEIKLKFAISGMLSSVNAKVGHHVKKGQLLASLNQTELQAYLDRALKHYDAERAEFDQKQKENLEEYKKRIIQDRLDISVKNVEITKSNLDATSLYSPIDGLVIEMDSLVKGVNISPARFVITVIDPSSLYFQGELKEEDLSKIETGKAVKVSLKAFPEKTLEGKITEIGFVPLKNGIYPVSISLTDTANLRLGLTGKANF